VSEMERPIPEHVLLGCAMAGLSAHDVAEIALGAAAWAAGIPIAENENLPTFQATVNRVLKAFTLRFDFDEFRASR
jgi:hypothetical protein